MLASIGGWTGTVIAAMPTGGVRRRQRHSRRCASAIVAAVAPRRARRLPAGPQAVGAAGADRAVRRGRRRGHRRPHRAGPRLLPARHLDELRLRRCRSRSRSLVRRPLVGWRGSSSTRRPAGPGRARSALVPAPAAAAGLHAGHRRRPRLPGPRPGAGWPCSTRTRPAGWPSPGSRWATRSTSPRSAFGFWVVAARAPAAVDRRRARRPRRARPEPARGR